MWDISLDSVDWSSLSVDFYAVSGVNISLSAGITHESPRVIIRPVPVTGGRCKPKNSTDASPK